MLWTIPRKACVVGADWFGEQVMRGIRILSALALAGICLINKQISTKHLLPSDARCAAEKVSLGAFVAKPYRGGGRWQWEWVATGYWNALSRTLETLNRCNALGGVRFSIQWQNHIPFADGWWQRVMYALFHFSLPHMLFRIGE